MHPGLRWLALAALVTGCDDSREIVADNPDPSETTLSCDGGHRLERLAGSVAGTNGQPLAGAHAQACLRKGDGVSLCLSPVTADAEGAFVIEIPAEHGCVAHAAVRVVADDSRPALYCPLGETLWQTLSRPLVLPSVPPAVSLPGGPETEARAAVFDDGLTVDIVPAQLAPGTTYADLRAVRTTFDPRCVPGSFEGVYAFSPEVSLDGAFSLSIPNTTKLPAGTEVDLLVQGGLACLPGDLDEGTLTSIGTATVSADGQRIDAGPVLPCLGWLAYRRH